MIKLLYIQPIIPSYRQHVIDSLAAEFSIKTASDQKKSNQHGFLSANLNLSTQNYSCEEIKFGKAFFRKGTIKALTSSEYDAILTDFDIKNITFWLSAVYCKIKKINFYIYGQGPYKNKYPKLYLKLIYYIALALCTRFICYNEYSKKILTELCGENKKIRHIDNTIINNAPVTASQKTNITRDILFIGRIRDGCGIENLIHSVKKAIKNGIKIKLHIVGEGPLMESMKNENQDCNIIYYGKVFDNNKISEISLNCACACYPGSAGLSVVHYMSLSLPPIVEQNMANHMGPEPAYITNNVNGFLFDGSENDGLYEAIVKIATMDTKHLSSIQMMAFKKYQELSQVNFGKELLKLYLADSSLKCNTSPNG